MYHIFKPLTKTKQSKMKLKAKKLKRLTASTIIIPKYKAKVNKKKSNQRVSLFKNFYNRISKKSKSKSQ